MAHDHASYYAIRSIPDDPTREIYKAIKYGDTNLLIRILGNMKASERASALATQTLHARGGVGRVRNIICTPVVVAAEYGNLDCVKILLRYKADVEGNSKFWTPLFAAVTGEYVDVLECLIENGADVNARTYDNCTPLMRASASANLDVVSVLVKHGANVNLQDKDGETALHYVVRCYKHTRCYSSGRSFDVFSQLLSCLVKHGADVNARSNDTLTPLMLASKLCNNKGMVSLLVEHGADMNLQDRNGETAIHFTIDNHDDCYYFGDDNVLKFLVENGADVNARTTENCTPLMRASFKGCYGVLNFLVEHGADIDLQDKHGDTALHYAVRGKDIDVVRRLLFSLNASPLCNKRGLTPLLYASNALMFSMVEELVEVWLEEEERINALELLGASLATQHFIDHRGRHTEKAFQYMKRGMEERFEDPSNPILKQRMEPTEAYQYRVECQTLEELAQIEGDVNAILMESLIIRERILGAGNIELLGPIQELADWHKRSLDVNVCLGLQSHAVEIVLRCNQSIDSQLRGFISAIYHMGHNHCTPSQSIILKVLEQTILGYETQREKMSKDLQAEKPPEEMKQFLDGVQKQEVDKLLDSLVRLLQIFAKVELREEDKSTNVPVLLQTLRGKNPRDSCGNTLIHLAAKERSNIAFYFPPSPFEFPCAETIKLLLNVGMNVNAINKNGDTPLHIAVSFKPKFGKLHLLTDMLKILLDRGARHDCINNDGKTAIDMAQTDEVRRIFSEKGILSP